LKDLTLTVAGAAQARGSVWIDLPVSRLTFPMHDIACGNKVLHRKHQFLVYCITVPLLLNWQVVLLRIVHRRFADLQNIFKQTESVL
jgi:hypothetical protein